MTGTYDYFVVLAGMRTGSNLLEECLAAMPGLTSHGELFNPHFFGKPKAREQFGFTLEARDENPLNVIEALKAGTDGLPGFRLFHDHDPRVIDHVLSDRRAAKIVLTRNPIDSYVSLQIARKTGQWWLGDLASARSAKVAFDKDDYVAFRNSLNRFQDKLRRALQTTGQTAFYIDYADLADSDILNGLGQFLSAKGPPDVTRVRAKVQNPTPLADRLTNPDEAEAALAALDVTDLGYIPSFEPNRGPGLRMFHACRNAPLLYMPIRGAGQDPVPGWMRRVDSDGGVDNGLTQKDLRRWMRQHPGHRSFTILRHPLPRAYDAFCQFILPPNLDAYADIRDALIARYGVALPQPDDPSAEWSTDRHSAAFLGFLKFLQGNLGGQTSLRVDYSWASQAAFLSAIAGFATPDRVIREETADEELGQLVAAIAQPPTALGATFASETVFPLEEIRTDAIDVACAEAYRRDYIFFGFNRWQP